MSLPTIPGLGAARLAIAPYLLWVKVAAVAILAAAIWWSWHTVTGWREDSRALAGEVTKRETAEANLADEIDCVEGTACAERIARLAADGTKAVETARQAAQEAARAEQVRVAAEGQAAVERAEKAASVATVRLREAEARYRDALSRPETGCAEQAREPLRCPLR